MSIKITIHKTEVMNRLADAFEKTAIAYDANLHLVLRLKRSWTESPGFGTTRRRNRTTVIGNFRNVFDLGTLDRSQKMTRKSPFRVSYSWSAPHSTAVHEGQVLRNGTRIPARRFTRVAMREANLPEFFKKKLTE